MCVFVLFFKKGIVEWLDILLKRTAIVGAVIYQMMLNNIRLKIEVE